MPHYMTSEPDHLSFSRKDLKARSELIGAAFSVVSHWSNIEGFVTVVLDLVADAKKPFAASMLYTIQSFPQRVDCAIGAISEIVGKSPAELLVRALERSKRIAKKRNIIAHRLWGVSNDYPNKIVSVDPDKLWQMVQRGLPIKPNIWRDVEIYSIEDFDEIIRLFDSVRDQLIDGYLAATLSSDGPPKLQIPPVDGD